MTGIKNLTWICLTIWLLASCANTSSSDGSSGGGSAGGGSAGGGSAGGGGGSPPGGFPGGGSPIPGGGGGPDAGLPGAGSPGGVSTGGSTRIPRGGSIPVPVPGFPKGTGPGGTAGAEGDGASDAASDGSSGDDIPAWEPDPSFEEAGEDSRTASASAGDHEEVDLEELEKTLDEAMGTFDEEILREQENVRNRAGSNGSADSGGREIIAGVGEFEIYGSTTRSSSPAAAAGGNSAQLPTLQHPDGGSSSDGDGELAVAESANVPPPSPDDDIVARQIREAALNEPDPAQREILWEEYRRYTDGD